MFVERGGDLMEVWEERWEFVENGGVGVNYEGICDAQIWRERHGCLCVGVECSSGCFGFGFRNDMLIMGSNRLVLATAMEIEVAEELLGEHGGNLSESTCRCKQH